VRLVLGTMLGLSALCCVPMHKAAAQPQQQAPDPVVMTPLPHNCIYWLTQRRARQPIPLESWVLGYVSGLALGIDQPNLLRGRDGAALFAWIDNYCRQDPLKGVPDAATALFIALRNENR